MLQFIFLLLISLSAFSDPIDIPYLGADFTQAPSHLHWKKIDTEHFEIIFPAEVEEEAQRVAHLLEKAWPFVSRSLEVVPPKIPLILQNQSVDSNGFVTLAPRRSEWYLSPSLDPQLTNTEWLKTLAIHEFRHVVQFQKTRQGFNTFLEWILGEAGQAVGLALTVPPWFLEGDAVGIETALTNGGRGRLPDFERELRTILLSGKEFTYDKAHLGSYRERVPNHYIYGYFLTTHLRNTYGDLFLSRLANRSAQSSYNPLSFYNSVDELTGESFEDFFSSAMGTLMQGWKERLDKLSPTPYVVKSLGRRLGWTNYEFPQVTNDGKILALKRGLSFINQFVLLDGKKEKTLFYPGPLFHQWPFRLRNDRLAYLELEVDPRWGQRDFARLKVYDLHEEDFILDVRQTKWRLATLNPEGEKLLVVEWSEEQAQSVQVIDLKGKLLKKIEFSQKDVITSIDWLSPKEAVVVIKNREDLKSIEKLSLESGVRTHLLATSLNNIGTVVVEEGHILFESPASGIDNIYLLENGSMRQLTVSRFGAYAPEVSEGKLIYNDYSSEGMQVVEKSLPWNQVQSSEESFFPFYERFAASEDAHALAAQLAQDQEDYIVKDYSQLRKSVNLHSWILLAPPLSNTITAVGFSRDMLNNLTLSAGAQYNLSERVTSGFVSAAWTHFWPVFDLQASYSGRRQDIIINNEEIENRWEEGVAEAGVAIPWNSIHGRMLNSFRLRGLAKLIKVTNKLGADKDEISDGVLFSPGAEFDWSFLSRGALRDILPPLGLSVAGRFEEGRDITGDEQRGALYSVDSRYYLPGLWHHHSFYHQFAYEKQRDHFYQYSSLISYPRGTKYSFLEEFTKYSANYTAPLFYPDLNLSRYLYLKRIYGNLFYDELNGRVRGFEYAAASTGWEVLLETNFLRIFIPITWGVRGNYVITGRERSENYELFIATTLATY